MKPKWTKRSVTELVHAERDPAKWAELVANAHNAEIAAAQGATINPETTADPTAPTTFEEPA